MSSKLSSGMDLARLEVVRLVRDLGHKQKSSALVQLASKIALAMRNAGGVDPFEKVKALISDMIATLEEDASADATKKAYCDKELAETNAKKADKSDDIEELSTKIDQASAKSAKLKEEVASLQQGLSKLVKAQAEMDKLRAEEKATFEENNAAGTKALAGCQTAIKVLKDYYYGTESSHGASEGAASGIIGLLEDAESRITAWLADMTSNEEAAAAEYKTMTKENEIDKAAKEKDVSFKTKEAKELDKATSELSADKAGTQEELDAVLAYLSKIEEQCIAKPEAYEERKARREAEIAGLKQALDVLESETALVQRRTSRRKLRGGKAIALVASR